MKKHYIVTVQLLVPADSPAECADAVSEMLTQNLEAEGVLKDWAYLKVGGQRLTASQETYIDDNYEEGEAFNS